MRRADPFPYEAETNQMRVAHYLARSGKRPKAAEVVCDGVAHGRMVGDRCEHLAADRQRYLYGSNSLFWLCPGCQMGLPVTVTEVRVPGLPYIIAGLSAITIITVTLIIALASIL